MCHLIVDHSVIEAAVRVNAIFAYLGSSSTLVELLNRYKNKERNDRVGVGYVNPGNWHFLGEPDGPHKISATIVFCIGRVEGALYLYFPKIRIN